MSREEKLIYCTAEKFFKGYPFEVLRIVHTYVQEWHYHDYVQIWYVRRGQCIHCFGDVEYKLTKGDIFILPPGVPHKIISKDPGSTELLECGFKESFIAENGEFDSKYLQPFLISKDKVKPLFTLDGAAINEVEKIFDEIIFEYGNKEKFFELYIKANILKMLSIIARKYDKSAYAVGNNMLKYKDKMMKILDYMRVHCKEKIYIQDISEMAEMSASHFSLVFKQVTGQTFTEYLRMLKIAKAKELLLNHNKTLKVIAEELGFDDPAYFDRVFKKEAGMPPGQFRAMYKICSTEGVEEDYYEDDFKC